MATHAELIKAGSFNEKFKNTLRDYYSYGFKSYGDFESSKTTVNADWERLNNILKDYFEWSFDKGTAFFASADSQSMQENPFQRVYRFCKYNERDPIYFFNIILALAPEVSLKDGPDSLGILPDKDDALANRLQRLWADLEDNNPLSSSELALYCYDVSSLFDKQNNTINSKLSELCKFGILTQANKRRNATNRWVLADSTLRQLIENGDVVSFHFREHFLNAIDFFSRYMPLGTIGTHIKHRFSTSSPSLFRFKHEYFMQSLNDYNLIDLLYAIENQLWCEIKYKHGTSDIETTLICFPLDIKISSINGREYVSYYEPFKKSYSHLRLEFIDSINVVMDGDIIVKNGKRKQRIHINDSDVKSHIRNARLSMIYSWGVSTTKNQTNNAIELAPPKTIKLRIAYDPQTEYYIRTRLQREKRSGTVTVYDEYIDFTVIVSDDTEMLPWLRSFYSRIISIEGVSNDLLSQRNNSDIRQIFQALCCGESAHMIDDALHPAETEIWEKPDNIIIESHPCTIHTELFNEIFSIYYHTWADVLMKFFKIEYILQTELDETQEHILSKYRGVYARRTEEFLKSEIKSAVFSDMFMRTGFVAERRDNNERKEWENELKPYMKNNNNYRMVTAFRPKYNTTSTNFFTDILPLTTLECRWLATMISDPKIDIFLSESEIAAIRAFLQSLESERVKPLPFDKIHYFDRYTPSAETKQQEKTAMPILLDAIRNNCAVELHYISAQQNKITGKFRPIVIEYSKRDDLFRVYIQSCVDGRISVMNLGRIENIILTSDTFDRPKAEAALKDYREQNTKSVQIEFRNTRNVPDRILSEFSPWKKKCVYDKASEKYRLTIYYQSSDELELVVRLMGYGADIIFSDRENDIYKEIVRRVERQIELTRDYDLVR